MTRPITKAARETEQRFRDCMVEAARRQLFIFGEPEHECLEVMQWMVAGHKACRDRLDYNDIQVFTEEHAVEVKPVACEIIERAKRAGPPHEE